MRAHTVRCCAVVAAALFGIWVDRIFEGPLWAADDDAPKVVKAGQVARGRELFERVWRPLDARCRDGKPNSPLSGDGLGPVFNDTSCAACHSLGGVGGAGPQEKNVQIIVLRKQHGTATGGQLHPGLSGDGSATVLHRSSVLPSYVKWRQDRLNLADTDCEPHLIFDMFAAGLPPNSTDRALLKPLAEAESRESLDRRERAIKLDDWRFSHPPLFLSERNPPALFGASLIDAISNAAIFAAAEHQNRMSPQIEGRVALSNARVGRFGWQGQQSSLAEFTLTACAVELGLNVPKHAQASNPHKPDDRAPGLDMSPEDCGALVAFVASLAPPREQVASADVEAVSTGKRLFARIGCADCHLPELGGVKGIYSDLLLHNMGHPLAGDSAGAYGAFVAKPARSQPEKPRFVCGNCRVDTWSTNNSVAFECRTPPLWGVASSAPYLHDGRAATLRDAILMHAGSGAAAAAAFQKLDEQQRQLILNFLSSLVAPRPSDVLIPEPEPDKVPTAYNTPRKKSPAASFKPRRKPVTKGAKS